MLDGDISISEATRRLKCSRNTTRAYLQRLGIRLGRDGAAKMMRMDQFRTLEQAIRAGGRWPREVIPG